MYNHINEPVQPDLIICPRETPAIGSHTANNISESINSLSTKFAGLNDGQDSIIGDGKEKYVETLKKAIDKERQSEDAGARSCRR